MISPNGDLHGAADIQNRRIEPPGRRCIAGQPQSVGMVAVTDSHCARVGEGLVDFGCGDGEVGCLVSDLPAGYEQIGMTPETILLPALNRDQRAVYGDEASSKLRVIWPVSTS